MARSTLDLVQQGKGSGADSTKYLKSDGAGGWVLFTPSTGTTFKATAVTGTQNGVNKVFTIANALLAGSEQFFINGQLLTPGAGNDYVYDGNVTVTLQAAMFAPAAGDVLRCYGEY